MSYNPHQHSPYQYHQQQQQQHQLNLQQQQNNSRIAQETGDNYLDYSLGSLDINSHNNNNNNNNTNMTANSSFNNNQQPTTTTTGNNNSNFDSNHLNNSNEKIAIDTTNITNPALNSFFQLPFELQIQQFPLTNPPLFDFQQPYYNNYNNNNNNFAPPPPPQQPLSGELENNSTNEPYNELQQHLFPQSSPPNQYHRGSFSPNPHSNTHFQQQQLMQPNYYNGQPTLRRRISISNGQIGQLVQFTQQQIQLQNPTYSPEDVLAATAALIQQGGGAQQPANANAPAAAPTTTTAAAAAAAAAPPTQQPTPPSSRPVQQQQQQQQTPVKKQEPKRLPKISSTQRHDPAPATTTGEHPSGLTTNANGVPQHQLIYNNEVIFNPNNGPIPGTSAWKKQKLLERNRIAASKCRQRKKQQQQRLEQDIDKYVRDNRNLSLKLKILEKKLFKFSKIMEVHFQKCHKGDNSFPLLKELINDTEEELARVKLEDDELSNTIGEEFDDEDEDVEDEDEESDFLNNGKSENDSDMTGSNKFDLGTTGMAIV